MKTLAQKWQPSLLHSAFEIFVTQLAKLRVVDIGRVEQVYDEGEYAKVILCDTEQTEVKCEVVSVGSDTANFQDVQLGQFVLVFFPTSSVLLKSRQVNVAGGKYNKTYAKCIPIGLQKGNIKINTTPSSLIISSPAYQTYFSETYASLDTKNMRVLADAEKAQVLVYANGTQVTVEEGGVQIVKGGEWSQTDGSLQSSDMLVKVDEAGLQVKSDKVEFKIGEDGVSIKSEKFKFDGDVEITGKLSAANGNFTAEV